MELTLPDVRSALPARELLHVMALSREGDRREGILLRQGKGWFQVSGMGHEALAALVYSMRPGDYLFPYYRDRAMALARGITNYELALGYLAKQQSSSAGRHMPSHFSDRRLNVFSVATPTAAQCIPAVGAAWGFVLAGTDQVSVTSVGDAATRQGEYYEAVAFALQENLPVVFVVEDNHYGISTPTDKFLPYRIGALGDKALVHVDARDPYGLFDAGREAIERARAGKGPTVLWCDMDRLCSHTSSDDQRVYRSAHDIAEDSARDPLVMFADRLIEAGEMTRQEWDEELAAIARQVDEDYQRADRTPDPDPQTVTEHMYGPAVPPTVPPVAFDEPPTMVTAVNQVLLRALDQDHQVVIFGEDIEDPKGGVFGVTKGLSSRHPDRVLNSPLAEATIIGSAVGLAVSGWKPVFEIQFTDFICPGLNQLMSQVSSLRWRTAGDWSCPMVLMAPYGAYLPGGGIWHSESNDGLFAHIRGINVMVPSTPEDAAGLLWSAINGNDPSLFLLPKHIFRKRPTALPEFAPVPIGSACIRRAGTDVTLVTWGNCTEIADEAADRAAEAGVSVEIIDLRTLVPCDYGTIEASVKNTGRLVVLHEDSRTAGYGQTIIAEMVSTPERFNLFFAPPQLVARQDAHIGYNPTLEYAALPDVDEVVRAITVTMA